jgi:hypothetical protein
MQPSDSFSFRLVLRMLRTAGRGALSGGGIALAGAALLAAGNASGYSSYGAQIPNLAAAGGCDGLCHATGYLTSPLYIDFAAAGFTWNPTFALDDSDGDGFSNGWELQDPAGTWVSGTANPGDSTAVSNPAFANSVPPLPVAVVPTSIMHSEAAGDDGSESFSVENVGNPGAASFSYSVGADQPWMTPDPTGGTDLPPGSSDPFQLLFMTDGLSGGQYTGNLTVSIDGIDPALIPMVPVTLTVPEPGAAAAGAAALLALALGAAHRRARRAPACA